jgi:DNA modification methylase
MENRLYFGDNLHILRTELPDECVDLVYLDPPFNSKATYNVLFKEVEGTPSAAQIKAFTDFWHWDEEAARTYHELTRDPKAPPALVDILSGFERFLRHNDMFAYLVMMAPRLLELHRVLKKHGSVYLHCDPTAGHYLKMVMDAIFSHKNFRGEIIWKRTSAHSNARRIGNVHQNIFFYTKSDDFTWNPVYVPYDEGYVRTYYRYKDKNGRRFMSGDLVGHKGVNPEYEWRGIKRPWRYPKHRLDELDAAGRIFWTRNKFPRYKRYLEDMPGMPVQSTWTDILPVVSWSKERLGYQTQKPIALLERIIRASSNEGDWVLDPFCGCGTTVDAAQSLGRRWIGIDITYLAINLIKNRLRDRYGSRVRYEVHGEPQDMKSAEELARLDRFQFEVWALSLIEARPAKPVPAGGPDRGIDGVMYFFDEAQGKPKKVVVQVKSGAPSVRDVRDLVGTAERERAAMGVLLILRPPTKAMITEAASAGFYHSPGWNKDYPRLQLLEVGDLLAGRARLQAPPQNATFTTAQRARENEEQEKLPY